MPRRHVFIGDLQGCWDAFQRLLDRIAFDPAADRLCLAGDLVNRGGKSLKVLRQVRGLGDPHFTVLGNHDLHLLAYWQNHPRVRKKNPEFEKILDHAEGPLVLEWLRQQPVLWTDDALKIALVHAGVDPRWDRARARACADELESLIRGPHFDRFIDNMYGNRPVRWKPDQKRLVRARTLTNVFTRMRFARSDGKLELESSGDLNRRPKGYQPWFELIHPDWSDWTVVFGHWSMLGHYDNGQVLCLDSGCVWGGSLTAWIVEEDRRRIERIDCS